MQKWSLLREAGIESDSYKLNFGMSVKALQAMFNKSYNQLSSGIYIDGNKGIYIFDFDSAKKLVGITITGNYGTSLRYQDVELLDTQFDKLKELIKLKGWNLDLAVDETQDYIYFCPELCIFLANGLDVGGDDDYIAFVNVYSKRYMESEEYKMLEAEV
jgi:hypothetical protein